MVRIISTTDFSIGLYLSGFGHLAILTFAIFGDTSFSKYQITSPMVTDVRFISTNNFYSKNISNIDLFENTKQNESVLNEVIKDEPKEYKEGIIGKINRDSVEVKNKFIEDLTNFGSVKGKGKENLTSLEKPKLDTMMLSEDVKSGSSTSKASLYKRFYISDSFLLQEVFKDDPITNTIQDNQLIKELQVIIEPAVERCFNVKAVGMSVSETSILVDFSIFLDGKPDRNSIELISFEAGSEEDAKKLFDTAKRAIIRCGISGYDLPREKYDNWQHVQAKFNSKGMQLK